MLALSDTPTKDNSPVTEMVYSVESAADGVFSVTTQTRYNAAGEPLSATQKKLISQLSGTIENKSVFVSERGLTSSRWTEYSGSTKRVQYSTVTTSSITAESVTVDGDVVFQPQYDADGNQTRVKTSTGIWALCYDAENRSTDFTSQAADGTIASVHCEYDYTGRRTTKMVTVGNNVTQQQRYIYRGYLQVACIDLTRSHHPALWYIAWDPTQPVATRPLAIQKDGSWFTYGWDLTKNICELYGTAGYIRTAYTYSPYGQVTSTGDVEQTIQWSSEYNDTELGLVYYNYRHYNPMDGRWIGRDRIEEYTRVSLYEFVNLSPPMNFDVLGLEVAPRICKKNYNAPRTCVEKTSQEYCQYECECPKGYYWSDLGTGYEQLYRPCSEPDAITSGTCKTKKRLG